MLNVYFEQYQFIDNKLNQVPVNLTIFYVISLTRTKKKHDGIIY